jgi:hypothetical protein
MAKESTLGNQPNKPPPGVPGVNGYKYKEQFGVVIVCKDAGQQQKLYAELRAAGHKVKVVCV